MSRQVSPSTDKVYGLERVSRLWGVSRATIYRHRHRSEEAVRRRPGPQGAMADEGLVAAIRQLLSEAGGGVVLIAGPTAEPAVLAEMLDAGETRAVPGAARAEALALSDARHPVFASLGPLAGALGSARVTRAMFLDADRIAVLARYTSGAPALAERRRAGQEGRTLILTTDISNSWNDLALHPAFVPLLHEMTAHVDGRPHRAREYVIGSPDAPAFRPGIASLQGRDTWRAAVNVDAAESDSATFLDAEARSRIAVDDRVEQKAAAARREREAEHPLWRYAIAAMLAMLLAEGLIARRAAPVGQRETRRSYVGT